MAFAVEIVPDDANLFRRIHHTHLLPAGKISSAAFKTERMSVDWEKYREAKDSANVDSPVVVVVVAGECKTLGQTIEHTPIEPDQPFGPNQAHTEVCGSKKGQICTQLRDLAKTIFDAR